jgi:hypothetical protein
MTPNVETGAPAVETGGLVSAAAAALAVGGGGFCRGRHNLAELARPVHFQNPAPIVAEPQPLAARVSPDDRLDAIHRVGCRGGVEAGGLVGGIPADPLAKLCGCFNDHASEDTRPWKPTPPPTVETGETKCPPQDIGSWPTQTTKYSVLMLRLDSADDTAILCL